MASVSYQLTPGQDAKVGGAFYPEDVATGTAAPTTGGAVEVRIDLANTPQRKQVVTALKGIIRRIEDGRYGPADFGNI